MTDRGTPFAWGLADDGDIAIRVLDVRVPERPGVERTLGDRIRRAEAVRMRLVEAPTDTYRVVNGAGDGLPGMVVDRYGSLAVVRLYSAAWVPWLDAIVGAVRSLGWCTTIGRRLGVGRVDGSEGLQVLWGPEVPDRIVVTEGNMRLLVRPHDGQKTGMFLDQREHRALVGRWASGRIVANLFAYHGGFSVAAALGGAAHVTTVDIAPEAIGDARENFLLNGLDPDQHAFEVADVFSWKPRGQVDLLVVDPPSLARDAKAAGAARSAYRKLHRHLGGCVARDGLLASASCTARIGEAAWHEAIAEGLTEHGPWSWLHRSNAPPDHPVAVGHAEGHYLKFALLRRR